MNNIQKKLSKALEKSTQFKCAVESGVSIPTIQNIVGGKKVNEETEKKILEWLKKEGEK